MERDNPIMRFPSLSTVRLENRYVKVASVVWFCFYLFPFLLFTRHHPFFLSVIFFYLIVRLCLSLSLSLCICSLLKSQLRPSRTMFVYKMQVNPIHTILKYGDYYDFMDRQWYSSLRFESMAVKRILKINNSWTELFNFQNSFNCH